MMFLPQFLVQYISNLRLQATKDDKVERSFYALLDLYSYIDTFKDKQESTSKESPLRSLLREVAQCILVSFFVNSGQIKDQQNLIVNLVVE